MEIYDALKKDHRTVLNLLDRLIALDAEDDRQHRSLIAKIRDELIPHSRAEEAVFYNTLRSIKAAKGLVMHGYKEHMEIEGLLRAMQLKDKLAVNWKKTARKLKAVLEDHIQEEEGQIFAAASALFTPEEAIAMGDAFRKLKPKIQKEGFLRTTSDMVINLISPHLADSMHDISHEHRP